MVDSTDFLNPRITKMLFLLILLALGSGCGSENGAADMRDPSAWTVMVYMAGDNDISDAAFADINEMEQVGSSSDVRVVAQVEFDPDSPPFPPGNTLRGMIIKDSDPAVLGSDLTDIGNKDMTDPQTLTEFITWAAWKYPAEHYLLLLWGHGSGWKSSPSSSLVSKGMFTDQTSSGTAHLMAISELAEAVHDSTVVFDLINLDSCLMGMYEVAHAFKDISQYLTVSEGLYPIDGDPYAEILESLRKNPQMNGCGLADIILDACREFYEPRGIRFTKSAIDLSRVHELRTALSQLVDVLLLDFDTHVPTILDARESSVSFTYTTDQYASHDLGDFLDRLDERTDDGEVSGAIHFLRHELDACVSANEVFTPLDGDPVLRSQGLSIYLPASTQVSSTELSRYSELPCNQGEEANWADLVSLLMVTENGVALQ
ncbi:MAG: clostripain-related cysteine peptidase [Desulfomonilia bacterium]